MGANQPVIQAQDEAGIAAGVARRSDLSPLRPSDKTLQNPTESDANHARCETNPLPAKTAPSPDKILQNPTESNPKPTFAKTNPRPASSRVRKPATALSPRQIAAVGLLCRGYTVTKVAAALGISRQTVWEWRRDPRFERAIAQYSAEVLRSMLPAAGQSRADPEQHRRLTRLCGRDSAEQARDPSAGTRQPSTNAAV